MFLKLGFRFLGKVSLRFRKMRVAENECRGEERGALGGDALPVDPASKLGFEGLGWAAPMSLTRWVPTS